MRLLQLWAAELAFCCLLTAIVCVLTSAGLSPQSPFQCARAVRRAILGIPGNALRRTVSGRPRRYVRLRLGDNPDVDARSDRHLNADCGVPRPVRRAKLHSPGDRSRRKLSERLDDTCRCVPEVTPTATVVGVSGCVGDCDGDGQVTIQELILAVEISLGESAEVTRCSAADENDDLQVTVDELVRAVDNALDGCPMTCVPFPPLAPTFAFTVSPGAPQAGDHVDVSIHISGGAPHGVYRLVPTGDVVDVTGPTYEDSEGSEVQLDSTPFGRARLTSRSWCSTRSICRTPTTARILAIRLSSRSRLRSPLPQEQMPGPATGGSRKSPVRAGGRM